MADGGRLEKAAEKAAQEITFAGAAVQSDGSFSPVSQGDVQIGKSNFVIKVPAASAVVVVIK